MKKLLIGIEKKNKLKDFYVQNTFRAQPTWVSTYGFSLKKFNSTNVLLKHNTCKRIGVSLSLKG